MFPCTKNRNEGTFGCSPVPKTGTRARSPKPPFYKTAIACFLSNQNAPSRQMGREAKRESALQNQFFLQVSCNEDDRAWRNGGGGGRIIFGGSKTIFGDGFCGMFSHPLSFPPPPSLLSEKRTQIANRNSLRSESLSTRLWCAQGFGAAFVFTLDPSQLHKQARNPGKGHFYFCAKPWYAPNPVQKGSDASAFKSQITTWKNFT